MSREDDLRKAMQEDRRYMDLSEKDKQEKTLPRPKKTPRASEPQSPPQDIDGAGI